jgi:hypothetical protein
MITLAQSFCGRHKKTKHLIVKMNIMIENEEWCGCADILTKPLWSAEVKVDKMGHW